jgi:hypothetical protein
MQSPSTAYSAGSTFQSWRVRVRGTAGHSTCDRIVQKSGYPKTAEHGDYIKEKESMQRSSDKPRRAQKDKKSARK